MASQKNNDRISKVFGITAFFDKARWEDPPYRLMNFQPKELSADEKLLTHWLCYITDRQTDARRIWDVGAFIFSQIVEKIKGPDDLSLLNPANHDRAYFIKRRHYPHVGEFRSKLKRADDNKYLFTSRVEAGESEQLADYGFPSNFVPYFIPRYYPADYKAILSTYVALERYGYSLANYLKAMVNTLVKRETDPGEFVPKLLFSLHLLSYKDIRQPRATEIDFPKFLQDAQERRENVMRLLNDCDSFETGFRRFRQSNNYYDNLKRPWCALRDWFKYRDIKTYFEQALKQFEHVGFLKNNRDTLLRSLELPGDTWNNKFKFRKCVLENTEYAHRDNMRFGKLLREICGNNGAVQSAYPEQFDITVDFVRTMCYRNNCDICPYGALNGKGENLKSVCMPSNTGYCPVALACCGYRYECPGREKCDLRETLGLGSG